MEAVVAHGDISLDYCRFADLIDLNRVTIRPLILGGQLMYQAEYTYPKKVTHANLSAGDAAEMSLSLIANDFKQVNIFLTDEEIQVLAAKP